MLIVALEPFLEVLAIRGLSLRPNQRTSGMSILPIPWPSKSTSIVTRDRALSPRGATVTCMIGLIGPSTP